MRFDLRGIGRIQNASLGYYVRPERDLFPAHDIWPCLYAASEKALNESILFIQQSLSRALVPEPVSRVGGEEHWVWLMGTNEVIRGEEVTSFLSPAQIKCLKSAAEEHKELMNGLHRLFLISYPLLHVRFKKAFDDPRYLERNASRETAPAETQNDSILESLRRIVLDAIHGPCPTMVYLSGPPGTGKTTGVDYILSSISKLPFWALYGKNLHVIKVQCTVYSGMHRILAAFQEALGCQSKEEVKSACSQTSDKYLIVVFDEMPLLLEDERGRRLMSQLLELSCNQVLFIGIGNCMGESREQLKNLTQESTKLHLLTMKAYSTSDLISIMRKMPCAQDVSDQVVTFIAKRNTTGDARKSKGEIDEVVRCGMYHNIGEVSRTLNECDGHCLGSHYHRLCLQEKFLAVIVVKLAEKQENVTGGDVLFMWDRMCQMTFCDREACAQTLLSTLKDYGLVSYESSDGQLNPNDVISIVSLDTLKQDIRTCQEVEEAFVEQVEQATN